MKHYTFVDYATQGYITLVGLLILLFQNERVPGAPLLIALHLVALIAVHGLIRVHARRLANRALDFVRHFYPVLLYTGFYRETGVLNEMFVPSYLDVHFVKFEQRLVGFQPSLAFMQWLPYRWASELFYSAYFSYYLMIVGVGLALFLRERRAFFHYVSVVSFTFYCCYLAFIFLPVTGPRLFFREVDHFSLPAEWLALGAAHPYPEAVKQGIMYHVIATIYDLFEPPGAAFPSSHVAVAICTLYFSYRYLPRIRHAHLVTVILLCLSTVYCRFHYAVDVVAGILTAVVLVPLGNWLYRCWTPPLAAPEPACPAQGQDLAGAPPALAPEAPKSGLRATPPA
jgi:membrane-associated phospholipid phosphatase